jgi:hydroxypyruvate isomerase
MLNRRQFTQRLAATAASLTAADRLLATPRDAHPFRLSVMLWTLRPKYTAEQAIELVARAGYNGFELVDEDKHWSAADVARVRARIAKLGIVCDAISGIHAGFADPDGGERLADELPPRMDQAERLGCRRIILLSGKRVPGMSRDAQHALCVENLKRAGELAAKRQFELLLEPIDALENPPIYLTRVAEAFAIARTVKLPSVSVLYDFYHEARGIESRDITPALISELRGNVDLLGLVHVANVPGRCVPSEGEIRYLQVYDALRKSGYRGWLAMEFMPFGKAESELRKAASQICQNDDVHGMYMRC